jgi:hypothetical protein
MNNSKKIILDLCGGTGAWSKPYKDNGYYVRVITLPEYDVRALSNSEQREWKGYREIWDLIRRNEVYGILAAPPCTMFSIARNDKTAKIPRDVREGMSIVQACLDIIHECLYSPYAKSKNNLKFWCLENPASGYLDRFLGRPSLIINPYEYGDPYTKKTALWGMFKDPKKNLVKPERRGSEGTFVKNVESFFDIKKHQIPEGYKEKTKLSMRTIVRSITPEGFAKAFYEANQ